MEGWLSHPICLTICARVLRWAYSITLPRGRMDKARFLIWNVWLTARLDQIYVRKISTNLLYFRAACLRQ